ncbi:Zn-dependent hydrolase [Pseudorhodoplanes sinuspersici]|uniref:Zn-dependent hydrolase n=1 Tax=Pseudorhodoplanes sinuspersici TaxID=1235591 RepID=A0A1W6ZKB4_9HYPH|nr:Zn-dependent hydrolase [Pseudorhodoplanes sinuspersici]ARP97848.1 Zn-dependent hydrolase [Pseudorhodoplanes sinuspersici]RKE68420.1 N-carbamoyl-L-amino-acid hydrolase [Pseudorhodoplanes sinuspersici]
MASNLPIDGARLWDDLMQLAAITEPDKPYTRRSFSPLFDEGRAWLRRRFEEAGLATRIDAAGNLIGRRDGSDPSLGTIMIGSHSDTVPSGGRFDGIAGVLTALEIARSLADRGVMLRHAIEVVDFLAEEPSEFGLSCIGSRGMAGAMEARMLGYNDPSGEVLAHAIDRVGGKVSSLTNARRSDIAAFFELHIEQGLVLQDSRIDVGIVTAIVGITRVEIVFRGAADHAGTTPMHLRRDAFTPAAKTAVFVDGIARELVARGEGHFVATIGIVSVAPGASNVVPQEARIVIDARSENRTLMDEFLARLDAETAQFAVDSSTERAVFEHLSDTSPTACDSGLRELLRDSANALGFSSTDIASGAGHDAAFVARIAPAAMLFIPCRDGKSHAPEEWAEPDALAAGTAVIADAVMRFDRMSPAPRAA